MWVEIVEIIEIRKVFWRGNMKKTIIISPSDSVAVALFPLKKGEEAEGVVLLENIEKGHKFAVKEIKYGERIIKYGAVIGTATADIAAGSHVHSHNMTTGLSGTLSYSYNKKAAAPPAEYKSREIFVYERKNNEIGIRNELWVIPTVGCVNAQVRQIVTEF